jgi:hypothetical protein
MDISIIYSRGQVEFQAGYNKKALDDYNEVIKRDSAMGDCYLERGLVKAKMGLKTEACEDFHIAKRFHVRGAVNCIDENCH